MNRKRATNWAANVTIILIIAFIFAALIHQMGYDRNVMILSAFFIIIPLGIMAPFLEIVIRDFLLKIFPRRSN